MARRKRTTRQILKLCIIFLSIFTLGFGSMILLFRISDASHIQSNVNLVINAQSKVHNYQSLTKTIVDLIKRKYNYTNISIWRIKNNKLTNKLKKYNNKPHVIHSKLPFIELNRTVENIPYYRSLENLLKYNLNNKHFDCTITEPCTLPPNISFVFHNALGKGGQMVAWKVSVANKYYALKIVKAKCRNIQREYTILKKIEEYCTYFNISHSSMNIPFLYPNIPGYFITEWPHLTPRCFILQDAIPNATIWGSLYEPESKIASIIKTKKNIYSFLMDCYKQIMNVFYALYDIGVSHNDFTEHNLLIDMSSLKCYVIDFGLMWYRNGIDSPHHYRCPANLCSVVGFSYLISLWKRRKFMDGVYGAHDAEHILHELVMYDKQYQVTSLIFHAFVQLNYAQNSVLFNMNKNVYQLRKNDSDAIIGVICQRLKMLAMIQDSDSEMLNEPLDKSSEFWKLMSIFQNDVMIINKSTCKLLFNLTKG